MSDVTVTVTPDQPVTPAKPEKPDTPRTGDESLLVLWMGAWPPCPAPPCC